MFSEWRVLYALTGHFRLAASYIACGVHADTDEAASIRANVCIMQNVPVTTTNQLATPFADHEGWS